MKLHEQLKKHLEETNQEQLKREFFEIDCFMYDINKDAKNAKRKLAWAKFKAKFMRKLRKIEPYLKIVYCVIWAFLLGVHLILEQWVWVFISFFFTGWFVYLIIDDRKRLKESKESFW